MNRLYTLPSFLRRQEPRHSPALPSPHPFALSLSKGALSFVKGDVTLPHPSFLRRRESRPPRLAQVTP